MLSKIALSLVLALAPVIAVSQEVYEGSWPDGTSVAWQCQKNTQGTFKFIFVLPDGKKYAGTISCGTSV